MEVTCAQLAGAIEAVHARLDGHLGDLSSDALAKRLLGALPAAEPEPEPGPDAAAAGAHACDDQCPADPEVHAIAALLPALPLVSKLGHDARERVMEWATRRACDGLVPF